MNLVIIVQNLVQNSVSFCVSFLHQVDTQGDDFSQVNDHLEQRVLSRAWLHVIFFAFIIIHVAFNKLKYKTHFKYLDPESGVTDPSIIVDEGSVSIDSDLPTVVEYSCTFRTAEIILK